MALTANKKPGLRNVPERGYCVLVVVDPELVSPQYAASDARASSKTMNNTSQSVEWEYPDPLYKVVSPRAPYAERGSACWLPPPQSSRNGFLLHSSSLVRMVHASRVAVGTISSS